MPEPTSHAFKEWSAIVAALGVGAQSIILRKGGIAEGRGGFDPARASRFWLYPTRFHAQREKLKPAAARFLEATESPSANASPAAPIAFHYYADLVAHRFMTDWSEITALSEYHLWTEAAVRERYDWSKPAGLHLLLVRVHRLAEPLPLPADVDTGGCKSWIELPLALDPATRAAAPVMPDATFAALRGRLPL